MVWGSVHAVGVSGTLLQGSFTNWYYVVLLLLLVFYLVSIAGMWKVFEKAGLTGWLSLIPILNVWLYFVIAGLSGWWLLGMAIPLVNLVVWGVACIGLANRFGKSIGYGVLLAILPSVFLIHLGFGSASYQGPR